MVKEEEINLDAPAKEVPLDKIEEAPKEEEVVKETSEKPKEEDLLEKGPSKEDKEEPKKLSAEEQERLKRQPAQIVKIKDLKSDMKRVCVAGTVVSKNEELYSFMIDDGDGNVLVLMNDMEKFNQVQVGQFIRVFARIWGEGDEIELQADIAQDFSKIDKDLYMKLF